MRTEWIKEQKEGWTKTQERRRAALAKEYTAIKCGIWGHQFFNMKLKCECGAAETFITHG